MTCFKCVYNHVRCFSTADEEKRIMGMNQQPPVHVNEFVDMVHKKKRKGYMEIEFKVCVYIVIIFYDF